MMKRELTRFTDVRRQQSGLSLIELMIAVTIGLLLIAVIGNVYLAGRQSFRDQDESARLQETGRFVLDMVSRVVLDAGRADVAPDNTLQKYVLFPAVTAAGVNGLAINGVNGAAGAPDTLITRFISASAGEVDCLGGNTTGAAAAPVLVTQSLAVDTVGRELECSVNGGTAQPLASNIEDFQVTYGVDSNGVAGGWNADRYLATTNATLPSAAAPEPLPYTVAVRVCILVTTADNMAPAAQQYVDCNGAVVNAADRRIRRAFTKVIGLRNRLG
jgi:type IV pilus assembly protein PilW